MSCAHDKHVSSSDPVQSSHPSTKLGVKHTPVLLHEVAEVLALRPNYTVVDATLGSAGHARAIVSALRAKGIFVGIDADSNAVREATDALACAGATIHLVNSNFRYIARILSDLSIERVNACVFDLGWRSEQLQSGRGFSFKHDDPLIMTYSKELEEGDLTAATIVNSWEEESIADILWGWGEERFSRKIAKAIVARRSEKPIQTSRELADIVVSAIPTRYRMGKIHPATKTFQALRMAVNDEIGALEDALSGIREYVVSGGRIAVITFHSIEDRLVKRMFRSWEKESFGKALKKIRPSDEEVKANPRARSAILRVFETF